MTPEQAQMMALADKGLSAAELLLNNGFPEFAASRAYYAMFAGAEAALLSKGLSFSKHSAVISAFGQHFAKPGLLPNELHRFLLDAQEHRQAADYAGGAIVGYAEAEADVRNAKALVRAVRDFLDALP